MAKYRVTLGVVFDIEAEDENDASRMAHTEGMKWIADSIEDGVLYRVSKIEPMPDYNAVSHVYCWDQKQPCACGMPLSQHAQCCLCSELVTL